MARAIRSPASSAPAPARRSRAVRDVATALPLALAGGAGTWWLSGLPANYLLVVAVLYGGLAGVVLRNLPVNAPDPGLGAANRVTLGRAALAMPVFALAVRPGALDPATAWWVISLSTVVLVLDGFDGRIARRTGTETAFGARFDMEVDAALILALSLLVWGSGRVGAWVLLIGAMRYAFVAGSWIWPALGAELPPSVRRKVVCVVQGVALLVALGPIIPEPLAVAVSAGGLAALTYSFAVDVRGAFASASTSSGPITSAVKTGE